MVTGIPGGETILRPAMAWRRIAIAAAVIWLALASTVASAESPTYDDQAAPAGATAACVDRTFSFALNHSGSCSHHGGVSYWIVHPAPAPPPAPAPAPPPALPPAVSCQLANGFLAFYLREPFLVGECIGSEFGASSGTAQWTTHGLLVWSSSDGVTFGWRTATGTLVMTNGDGVWDMQTSSRLPGTLEDYRPRYWQH